MCGCSGLRRGCFGLCGLINKLVCECLVVGHVESEFVGLKV